MAAGINVRRKYAKQRDLDAERKVEIGKLKSIVEKRRLFSVQEAEMAEQARQMAKIDTMREVRPSLMLLIANSLAMRRFQGEISEDGAIADDLKKYRRQVDRSSEAKDEEGERFLNRVMLATVSVAGNIQVVLENYRKDCEEVKRRRISRFKNFWSAIPGLEKAWKNVTLKLSSVGMALTGAMFWENMRNIFEETLTKPGSYVTTVLVATGVFLFFDKMFLKLVSGAAKFIDYVISDMKLRILEMVYSRRKRGELEVLEHIVKEEIEDYAGQPIRETDPKLIRKLSRTLPKV